MNILLTGVGFPGTYSIVKNLKRKKKTRIIGIDKNDTELARLFVDDFVVCPDGKLTAYYDFLIKLCKDKNINVILPTTTNELIPIQRMLDTLKITGTFVPMHPISVNKGIDNRYDNLNNKWLMMTEAERLGVPVPKFRRVFDKNEILSKARNVGFPDPICVKPIISNGGRGFRIVDQTKSENSYYESKSSHYRTFTELMNELPDILNPHLIVMEYLPGTEYTVDCLCDHGKVIYAIPRTRDYIKDGISFIATTVYHKDIIESCHKLVESFQVHGACGFQFKEDKDGVAKLIECNPRIQGGSALAVAAGADYFNDLIKVATGVPVNQPVIKWGTKMIRYYNEVYI